MASRRLLDKRMFVLECHLTHLSRSRVMPSLAAQLGRGSLGCGCHRHYHRSNDRHYHRTAQWHSAELRLISPVMQASHVLQVRRARAHPLSPATVSSPASAQHRCITHRAEEDSRSDEDIKRRRGSQHLDLEELSFPPSREELARYVDRPVHRLPRTYKRDDRNRIFCIRNIDMAGMKFIGFDMDFTLAVYKPVIDEVAFDMIVERLIEIGYPDEIRSFKFDQTYAVRGLFFDKEFGNLLKCDAYGNILVARHGKRALAKEELEELYPASFVPSSDIGGRYFVMNTLFNVPETSLYADLVEYFSAHPDFETMTDKRGVQSRSTALTWHSLFEDVRSAVDFVHNEGHLKEKVQADPERFIHRDPKLPVLLKRMRENGRKAFLATNSGYSYTMKVMSYLFDVDLEDGTPAGDWKSYFDLIVVSARKPLFFGDGTALREVDQETGALKLGHFVGADFRGRVFAGGSADVISSMLGARGQEVLYVGDHIFGDVLKSKKLRAWRTMLVVPELSREVAALRASASAMQHLHNLEFMLAEVYRGLESDAKEAPDVDALKKEIAKTSAEVNDAFNPIFGSIFKSGSTQSFFAMQTGRFADLYASSCVNLVHYPLFYQFRAAMQSLPHEVLRE